MRRLSASDVSRSGWRPWVRTTLGAPAAFVVACVVALAGAAGAAAATPTSPPPITITTTTPAANNFDGDIFLTPTGDTGTYANGVEIVNYQGNVIWFHAIPVGQTATDFRTQTYEGQPVLTWWQGVGAGGVGTGTDYIYNDHYQQIATVQAGNGYQADSHEFLITPQNTALITINATATANLTSIGGAADQTVTDGLVQEINIATGQVIFQWDSDGSIPFSNSEQPLPASPTSSWDWFHINSVHIDTDGNLIIDSRNTWAAYKINRTTGALIWELGGKRSTFAESAAPGQVLDSAGEIFAWQHDPEPIGNNEYTFFDDESAGTPLLPYSRVVTVQLNSTNDTATLVSSDNNPHGSSASSQGNAQTTANGDVFVGWGSLPEFSEFSSTGSLVLDAAFPTGVNTYRAYRLPWQAATTTVASVGPSALAAGGPVTYSATVSPAGGNLTPTGTVTFSIGATTLCTTPTLVNGAGSCSASNAPTGTDAVTATYSGDSNFLTSTGAATLSVSVSVTTASLSPTATDGFYDQNPTVALSATDTSGSGVAHTYYEVDNQGYNLYTGPFTITGDGTHQLNYYSVNGAGTAEAANTQYVQVDTEAPATTASVSPTPSSTPQAGTVNGPATVTLTANDTLVPDAGTPPVHSLPWPPNEPSGVALTQYQINGGGWQIYTGPFQITQGGANTISYRSIDNAGNVEATHTLTLQINPQFSESYAGTVAAQVGLSIGSSGSTIGNWSFLAGQAATYSASTTATVTSTATSTALTVADAGTQAPGHLVNGTYSLPQALQFDAVDATHPSATWQSLGATPLTLLTYTAPISSDAVTINAQQPIAATDALHTGTYGKTFVFTVTVLVP